MSLSRYYIFVLCVCVSVVPLVAAQEQATNTKPSAAASYFDEDDRGFENAKPPSDVILHALLATVEVKERVGEIEDQSRESLRRYFKTVPTDAGKAEDQVYVVTGTRLPLGAGDSDWFWIVQTRKQEARVLLFTIGHTLRFERHRTNGYRNIQLTTGTPAQPEQNLFRYDGTVYRVSRNRLREAKP